MLLWLLNLDFSGGFGQSPPTEFIPVISDDADIILQYEASVTIPGSRDTGV